MFYCNFYFLISPLRTGVRDFPDRKPELLLPVIVEGWGEWALSVYCDGDGQPEFIKCRIPSLSKQEIPPETFPILQLLKEHLLSVLRITFRTDTCIAQPSAVWSFAKEGEPYNIDIGIKEFSKNSRFDAVATRDLFVHSYDLRELMRLFVDGDDWRIPIQYRYLSLFKILELEFLKRGRWEDERLSNHLKPFEIEFRLAGFTGKLLGKLHAVRAKCAHIRTKQSGSREELGVTHLSHKNALLVERLLPIVRAASAAVINEKASGRFVLNKPIPTKP